jgi:hypothetical protein
MLKQGTALLVCLLAGCVTRGPDFSGDQYHYRARPHTVRVEIEHVSHPFMGFPFEPPTHEEDGLSQASLIAQWRSGRAYFDLGAGYNLRGRNGGGISGPAFMGTVRVGYSWELK